VDDYYLVVSALVPYKRIDLAIGAARRLGRRLRIVGTGPEKRRLKALAGPGVEFLGWRDDREVAELYARCRAVLFPAVEDFGIVPLEAAAAGRPTIALGRGGVLEAMIGPGADQAAPAAVLVAETTVEALGDAIRFHLMRVTDVPPFRDYALQLLPILVVWGFAFHAFDLYRPSRLGSHLSEWFRVAIASTLGVLVLIAIMTFAFRGYEYSR